MSSSTCTELTDSRQATSLGKKKKDAFKKEDGGTMEAVLKSKVTLQSSRHNKIGLNFSSTNVEGLRCDNPPLASCLTIPVTRV